MQLLKKLDRKQKNQEKNYLGCSVALQGCKSPKKDYYLMACIFILLAWKQTTSPEKKRRLHHSSINHLQIHRCTYSD